MYFSTLAGMDSGILASKFGNIGDAYLEYGFPYCFGNSLLNTGIEKPSEYSEELVDELIAEVEKPVTHVSFLQGENETPKQENPNIIFLQLESFFDPAHVKWAEFSKNPIPNFTELKIYCAAEMMWDCNRELRSLIEEFIFHYYDDKTGCVQKYFDYLNGHREYLEKNFNRKMIPGLYADYEVLSSGLYWSKEFLEEALSIMDNDAAIPEDYNSLTEYEWRRLGERLPCEYILLKNYLDELPKEIAKKKVDFVERIAAHIGGINRIGEFAPKDLPTYISEWKEKL